MEFLKELLGEDLFKQVESKINEHNGNEANKDKKIKIGNLGTGEYVSKMKYEDLMQQLSGKQTEIDTANGLIADLKKASKGNEGIQEKITGYESQVAELQAKLLETKQKAAMKVGLLSEKCLDIDYVSYVIERDLKEQGKNLELDENENIKGWDELISTTKTKVPSQFESAQTQRKVLEGGKLPSGTHEPQVVTKEQFDKMGYQSRLKLKNESPEIYAQMTGKQTQ